MTVGTENYVARDATRDGQPLLIRAIRPGDKPILQELLHHLSKESLYFRFFTFKAELTAKELAYFTELDFNRHVALVAFIFKEGVAVPAGEGRYILASDPEDRGKSGKKRAEVAFAVEEEYQGLGIATALLKHLTKIARGKGISQFYAFVLNENKKMLSVFANSGLPITTSLGDLGHREITLSLS